MSSELSVTGTVNIFISYSHEDEKYEQKLCKHLSPLVRNNIISPWDDRQIKAGDKRNEELMKNLNEADIILCLISPDFIHSDYCYLLQAQPALEQQKSGQVKVIPILLKPTDWKRTIFRSFQIIPRNEKPITIHRSSDYAFTEIAREITRVVDDVRSKSS